MNKKTGLALLLIVLCSINVISKDKSDWFNEIERVQVEGSIIDSKTGESLVGVQVYFKGLNQTVYTDLDGKFYLNNLIPGKYDVEIDYISYKKQLIKAVEIGSESTNVIKINIGML